jgi:hypothetical protein
MSAAEVARQRNQRRNLIARLKVGDADVPIIGYTVWWNLRLVDVKQKQFAAMLEECDLPSSYAREHNYRSAFIRALRSLEEERLIRKVEEDENWIIYQFTAEKKVMGELGLRLDYEYQTKITVDKNIYRDSGDFAQSVTEGDKEIRLAVIKLFEQEKIRYRSADVTRYLQKILRERADFVSLRDQGNVYFVPANYRSVIESVERLVGMLGGVSTFTAIPIPDVENSRFTVNRAVLDELNTLVKSLAQEVAQAQIFDSDEARQRFVNGKMSKLERIRSRVELYSEILPEKEAETLTQSTAELEAEILKPRTLDL